MSTSPGTNADHRNAGKSRAGAGEASGRSRARASTACIACRERRIRCVVPAGARECTRCKRSSVPCVMKFDDERRNRGSAKSHLQGLNERVSLLESMLRERDVMLPPSNTSPTSTQAGANDPIGHIPGYPHTLETQARQQSMHPAGQQTPAPTKTSIPDSTLRRLLSTGSQIQRDEQTGTVSFYGPIANCHVLAPQGAVRSERSLRKAKQESRAKEVVQALPLDTHDYLMELFWVHHNDVLFTVHQDAFARDKHAGRLQHYSHTLHLTILAMGYRFADKSRSDMYRIAIDLRESTLHQEAKAIVSEELDALGGVPSIAALLILGDLEVGVGRSEVGWSYTGIALRSCIEAGLHLDDDTDDMRIGLESEVRHAMLRACFVADRFWCLFLGRPTFLALRSKANVKHISAAPPHDAPVSPGSVSLRINEAIISLMDIAGKLIDDIEDRAHEASLPAYEDGHHRSYFRMAALDRELRRWLSSLPEELQSSRDNLASGPYSLYLLHQQYYALLIMLHRPFAAYDSGTLTASEEAVSLDAHFQRASRDICLKSALAMASLFRQHRQRFQGKRTFRMGMQQAGVGATALIAAIASHQELDRDHVMQCFNNLRIALMDMAQAFQPAEQMITVLDAAMSEASGAMASEHHIEAANNRSEHTDLNVGIANVASGPHSASNGFMAYSNRGTHRGDPCAIAEPPGARTQTTSQPAGSYDPTLGGDPHHSSHSTSDPFAGAPAAFAWSGSGLQGLPADACGDEWEFESINSMMAVPGLPEGDLMDLLMNYDSQSQLQSGATDGPTGL